MRMVLHVAAPIQDPSEQSFFIGGGIAAGFGVSTANISKLNHFWENLHGHWRESVLAALLMRIPFVVGEDDEVPHRSIMRQYTIGWCSAALGFSMVAPLLLGLTLCKYLTA